MGEILAWTRLYWAAVLIGVTFIVRFLVRGYHQRKLVRNLPGPPHSWILGHLAAMGTALSTQPSTAAFQSACFALKERYNLPDYFYLDNWPFASPMLMIMNVDMAQAVTVETSLPKHSIVDEWMTNFGGQGNLVSSEGAVWKKWRAAFNPGFSASHLMTLVPAIVEKTQIFYQILETHAKSQDLFRMEKATTKLTVDIIGKVVLDVDFNSQTGSNVLVDAFNSQVKWQAVGAHLNPSELWDIRRPFVQRYNNWVMDDYIAKRLDERFLTRAGRGKTKHVVDLALEEYLKEAKGSSGDLSQVKKLDPEFKRGAISNMKTFVFAGHDTTSSTICYAYYYLSKNPSTLAKVREELDAVFGADQSTVPDQLLENPHLLNKLEYMLAVTREVLRLQPPASTLRTGTPGFFLHDNETGETLPTEGFMVFATSPGLHRNPKYWHDPHAFQPERFLSGNNTNNTLSSSPSSSPSGTTTSPTPAASDAIKDAYTPFSKGPRNCIGQELALIETKVILALTVRAFDFRAAYDEVAALRGDGSGYRGGTAGVQTQFGDEAYQVQLGTAKPREGMPCRVSLRRA